MKGNIGLCGAHRTGKTTLAIALSEALNMPFVPINTIEVFERFHLHPKESIGFRTRLEVQEAVLEKARDIWFEMDEPFICDRTPIDMAAYTLAEVQGNTLDKELEQELEHYLADCFMLTTRYFDYLFLIPPAIPLGKASLSKGYIEHIHRLCVGFFHDSGSLQAGSRLPRSLTDLDARIKFVANFVAARDR